MSDDDILVTERTGDVLSLTFNRPDRYNAVNPALRDRLVDALESVEESGVRAVLLQGAGRGFCAGADLQDSAPKAPGMETALTMRVSTQRLVRALLECPVPVVSAVHGSAAGLGLVLAVGADVCVAAEDARFVPAFVQRALVPDGAMAFLLPRLVGLARAKDFLMRGRPWTAPEALRAGLIAEVVAPSGLSDAARGVADELAALPTATLALTKQMLAQSFEQDLAGALLTERLAQGLSAGTADAAEGKAAFLEKRDPRFQGR